MILTGQAKKDFISFMCKTYPNIRWHEYENMTDSMINALIIEWFDLIGLWKTSYNNFYVKYFRSELTLIVSQNLAITKANEIYNTSN